MLSKAQVRTLVRERLKALSPLELESKSAQLRRQLLAHPLYNAARTVALFAALPTEPQLEPLHDGSKHLCFPRVEGEHLQFYCVDPSSLVNGKWNVREPLPEQKHLTGLDELDLILVPGMAFSPEGARLGRGGGYYDRLLSSPLLRARRIGICFDLQIFQQLPCEAHDREVDEIIYA